MEQKIFLVFNRIEKWVKINCRNFFLKEKEPGQKKFYFAGVSIDNLYLAEALGELERSILQGKRGYVVTPNAAHICLLQQDEELKTIYKNASLVLADGMSIIFASRLLGFPLKERCCGTELFTEACVMLASLDKKIFLLGGQNGSEKIAEQKIKKMHPNLKVSSYSPCFGFENNQTETAKIVDLINKFNSDILFLFVGTPKSEKWIYRNISRLHINMWFSLGQTINYFAGTKKRAPKWIQKSGGEWFFRLCQEPKRLWKRYLIGNSNFLILLIREFFKIKSASKRQ